MLAVGGTLQLQQDEDSDCTPDGELPAASAPSEFNDNDSNTLMDASPEDEPSSAGSTLYAKVCRNEKQFEAWQRSRPWLVMNKETKSVQCSTCATVKRLGLHKVRGQREEATFVDGNVSDCKSAKTLLKKIDKHKGSAMHKKCEELFDIRENEQIRKGAETAQEKFVEKKQKKCNCGSCCFPHSI